MIRVTCICKNVFCFKSNIFVRVPEAYAQQSQDNKWLKVSHCSLSSSLLSNLSFEQSHAHTHTHTHKHTHKHSLTQTLTHLHALTHTHSYAPLTILSLRFYFSISPLPPFSESTVCVRDFDKLNVRHCGFFGFCLKSILAYDTVAPEKGCLL